MKLSELKPCAGCGGPLLVKHIGQWYVVRSSMAILNPQAANQTLGLAQFFQGSMALAEAFSPAVNDAVIICGDKEPALLDEVHLCFECFYGKPLGMLLEGVREKKNRELDSAPTEAA